MTPRELVQSFYRDVWNKADEHAAHRILDAGFRFRASLGLERVGPAAFCDYMRSIHRALGGYERIIEDVIEEDSRAAARMRFTGLHRGEFFGVPPTGRRITWAGAAFFTMEGQQIVDLWVLGDIDAVKSQLGAPSRASF
jgi:predicted ester cyclase